MDVRERARLDPSQVSDMRGRRGNGGRGAAIGGGGLGIVGLLLALLLGVNPRTSRCRASDILRPTPDR